MKLTEVKNTGGSLKTHEMFKDVLRMHRRNQNKIAPCYGMFVQTCPDGNIEWRYGELDALNFAFKRSNAGQKSIFKIESYVKRDYPTYCCITKCDVPHKLKERSMDNPSAKCKKCQVFKAFGKKK
jgi:hypothetical protein